MNDYPPKLPVAVVADSAASVPAEIQTHPQLLIVPMRLTLDGKSYLDGEEIAAADFYRRQRLSDSVPTTAAPSPAAFLDAFRAASNIAESVICLTVSSRYSSSSDAANAAAVEASEEMVNLQISVVDSQTAGGGEGLIVLEALRHAEAGLTLYGVERSTNAVIQRVRLVAMLDTLHYLWKGGRVPRLAMAGTSLLNIKPIFELRLGEAGSLARPRTRRKAMGRLLGYVTKHTTGSPIHACVMHADCPGDAEEIRATLESNVDCQELYVTELTPVLGAHIGPGMLGVAFWSE
ncbi:MAG: hypothetical protein BZY79_00990 [SAR202 cluster bacterium Casp-Chloro-G4]|nr:DegV family protein [Chloroflexota bacterium]MDA1228637.1 DegV family protein [Chloroflexota bacterium]PKB61994.1 MAG: hypothetical protein BZY79_00990 [SAR202 cluster bacterium Casp-Chloro-G4]